MVGGAAVPPLLGAVADLHGDMGIAMVVPLAFFVVAWTYPLAVNFYPPYRAVADAFTNTEVGLVGGTDDAGKVLEPEKGYEVENRETRTSKNDSSAA